LAVLSKKVVLLFLTVLVLLSIAVRYPLVEHERFQTDSYTIHHFAKSIADSGYAKWTFHALSYVGYYPVSYPSGSPFLLAEFSSVTGMDLESSILLVDVLFAVLFCLGAFLLARQFTKRSEYALLAAFFMVTGARFVDTTYWDASARGPVIVLMLLAVLVLFRAAATGQTRLLIIALLFGVGSFATHHMAVLLILFGLGSTLAGFQTRYLLPKFRNHKFRAAAVWNVSVAMSLAVVSFGLLSYFSDVADMNLRESSLLNINPPGLSIALNMAFSYTNQIGFIIVFAFLGIVSMFRERRLSVEGLLIVSILIAFIPMLGNTLYVSMLLAPFVCLLGVLYISKMLKSTRRILMVAVVLILMSSAVLLPLWSSDRWNGGGDYQSGQTVEVDSRVYSDATYLKHQYPGTFGISNANTFWIQLSVFSDTRFMASGVTLAINDDILRSDLRENVVLSSEPFPYNLYNWLTYPPERIMDAYVRDSFVRGYESLSSTSGIGEHFSVHSKLVVAFDNTLANEYAETYVRLDSKLQSQLLNATSQSGTPAGDNISIDSYMIYQSERLTLYAVRLDI
jgi:hypothetical protein